MTGRAWPLSAAATAILRKPRSSENELLKLTLKELVVRRVWRLEREPARSRWGSQTVRIAPGTAEVPALVPLPEADAAVRRAVEEAGLEVRDVARRLSLNGAPVLVRDAARAELRSRGLVEIKRRRVLGLVPRTVVSLTQDGQRWAADADERRAAAERSVAERSPGTHAEVLAMGALILFVAPPVLSELDELVRRPVEGGSGFVPSTGGTDGEGDLGLDLDLDLGALDGFALDDLDVFGSLDTSFDSAFDSGSSAGGGDGGGGGGDGGGGGGS